jgi:NADPH:quinone reductase-like Zn-dependent oxidoreductase
MLGRYGRAAAFQICNRIYGSGGHGRHARYMKVPLSTLVPLPDTLSFMTGAAKCGAAFFRIMG